MRVQNLVLVKVQTAKVLAPMLDIKLLWEWGDVTEAEFEALVAGGMQVPNSLPAKVGGLYVISCEAMALDVIATCRSGICYQDNPVVVQAFLLLKDEIANQNRVVSDECVTECIREGKCKQQVPCALYNSEWFLRQREEYRERLYSSEESRM